MQVFPRPLVFRFPSFFPRHCVEKIPSAQPESQALQLQQLIQNQKRVNSLIYVCKTDSKGKLNCRWEKE